MLSAPQGGNKGGTLSQNTAATYFAIVKAGLHRAFIDEYLTVDIAAKVKGIPDIKVKRETLTHEEAEMLAKTPCENEVLKRAFFFAVLTGIRLCDIQVVFLAGLDGATSVAPSSGGGGTSNDMPWRDKDEDFLHYAHRAMLYAHAMCYPVNRHKRTQNR